MEDELTGARHLPDDIRAGLARGIGQSELWFVDTPNHWEFSRLQTAGLTIENRVCRPDPDVIQPQARV
jgi:hypothetical protein